MNKRALTQVTRVASPKTSFNANSLPEIDLIASMLVTSDAQR